MLFAKAFPGTHTTCSAELNPEISTEILESWPVMFHYRPGGQPLQGGRNTLNICNDYSNVCVDTEMNNWIKCRNSKCLGPTNVCSLIGSNSSLGH